LIKINGILLGQISHDYLHYFTDHMSADFNDKGEHYPLKLARDSTGKGYKGQFTRYAK
jgi:hypothetical protein